MEIKKYIINGLVVASALCIPSFVFAQTDSHWGYEGSQGPAAWGHLKSEFNLCGKGQNQSPVNIDKTSVKVLDKIMFSYKDTPIEILNNGHTIQVNYQPGSYMKVAGSKYELLQFHFHSPSEHEVKGSSAPLEMHLVHKSATGVLAVVGVMFDKGGKNKLLQAIWENMPHKAKKINKAHQGHINAGNFLPKNQAYFFYNGSLTTPPCSEGVKWFVMQKTNTVAASQVKQFIKIIGQNARPVQALHSRNIRQTISAGSRDSGIHISPKPAHTSTKDQSGGHH